MSKYDGHYDAGYEAYIDGIHRDIADLQAENDKLRELVSAMWGGMCGIGANCHRCEHMTATAGKMRVCEYRLRMAELGIEVDE